MSAVPSTPGFGRRSGARMGGDVARCAWSLACIGCGLALCVCEDEFLDGGFEFWCCEEI